MGQNWAITIGINNYCNLQDLSFAVQDAESMRDYFQNDLKFQQVYHFSHTAEPIPADQGVLDSQPSFTSLTRFFGMRFERPFLKAGDNLWFFFAGHGTRYEDRDYLMPFDVDPSPSGVPKTAIPLSYITDRLRRCGADNIVLFIDACRSGIGRRDGVGIGEEKQQGVITFFSCSSKESSYEIEDIQQGVFTYALLESLRMQGEGNCATVERLNQRLLSRVPELSRQYKKPTQTPCGSIEPLTKYHYILIPKQANGSDVLTLINDAQSAELKVQPQLAKQLWLRVLAISPTNAQAIEGIERLAQRTPSNQKEDMGVVHDEGVGSRIPINLLSTETPPKVFVPELQAGMKMKNELVLNEKDIKALNVLIKEGLLSNPTPEYYCKSELKHVFGSENAAIISLNSLHRKNLLDYDQEYDEESGEPYLTCKFTDTGFDFIEENRELFE